MGLGNGFCLVDCGDKTTAVRLIPALEPEGDLILMPDNLVDLFGSYCGSMNEVDAANFLDRVVKHSGHLIQVNCSNTN